MNDTQKDISIDDLPYRPCVGIALFNTEGKVLVGERIDSPGAWQMPQGGIDPGEDIQTAVYREMLEEIGTDKADVIEIGEKKLRYDLPPHLLGRLWKNKYRGQEQVWVALRYTGEDADINLNAHNPPEFQKWQWVKLDDILDLIVPFKKDTYKEVIAMFKKHVKA
ncbi:MAG: RNA pyrophosphohydrolase [Pseudomonadota bacterium]|jgi:putative (di)nucleoside polyphosphate hydrolase|nr:RNA pyrophosphohydrolase [Pseudomonadota bacterium]MEC7703595.1 RNA pyrophosphohydrolase [Pseudomonadota bacterium]MEC9235374.1 RNA pyrophosphohydrolase [Pseudomonadota bacterium]MED5422240.1 RNA pyrophosphohydrolase [Pseudomonadota bacterium]MEE3322346.1 RNA pyrophosphohydrolase [Pseudomonadota bacterium]